MFSSHIKHLKRGILVLFLLSLVLYGYIFLNISWVPAQSTLSSESTIPKIPEKICIQHPEISFFMYHYIRDDDQKDIVTTHELSVPPGVFREQLAYIRSLAQNKSITLMNGDDFLKSFESRCFPGKRIWIFTSDDGWQDTYTDLVPIAREYNVPFFLGIIVNRIGKSGFVSSGEVQEIASNPLFTISSHSMNHHDESKMSAENEHYEMCQSKTELEKLIQKPVTTYIYPAGKMNTGVIMSNLHDCNYTLAWTTSRGKDWNWQNPTPDEINRIRVNHDAGVDLFKKILRKGLLHEEMIMQNF